MCLLESHIFFRFIGFIIQNMVTEKIDIHINTCTQSMNKENYLYKSIISDKWVQLCCHLVVT